MPWSIDGPSSAQLGYVRRRARRDAGDNAPPAMQTRRRARGWVAIGVILALVALIGLYGTAAWRQAGRDALAHDSVGTWVQTGSVGSILFITRPALDRAGASPDLSFHGSVDGHQVRGAVAVPSFPSLSASLHLTLLGQRWELRLPGQHMMTLTSASGRVITFWGA
jgi:hypothetical protein